MASPLLTREPAEAGGQDESRKLPPGCQHLEPVPIPRLRRGRIKHTARASPRPTFRAGSGPRLLAYRERAGERTLPRFPGTDPENDAEVFTPI
jgi:hypothetical protein